MATGYGVEAWCADGLVSGRFTTGAMTVALALYRRLITPRGSLMGVEDDDEELNVGLDVCGYIGAVGNSTALRALPGLVAGELSKDKRVRAISCTIEQTIGEDGLIDLTLTIDVTLHDSGEDFTLTVAADDVSAELLGVEMLEAA